MAAFTSALLLALGGLGGAAAVGATSGGAGRGGVRRLPGGQGPANPAAQAVAQPPSLLAPPPAAPPSALQTQSGSIASATNAMAATRKRLAAGVINQPSPAIGRPRLPSTKAPTFSMLGGGY